MHILSPEFRLPNKIMLITSQIFEAYLKCPTKCWLRFRGERGTGNIYSDWVVAKNETYRTDAVVRFMDSIANAEHAVAKADFANVKTGKWKYAANLAARSENLESNIHIVERTSFEGRRKPTQFTPFRFIFTNKLTKEDKLLLAYDALVLSEMLRRNISFGKVIHGINHSTVKIRVSALTGTVKKLTTKIISLLASDSSPDLSLNRHCTECEYRVRCRENSIEKDDLSLLAGMTEKERKKLNSKGIFTTTQLSFTFRPRRRPKRLRDKREKYSHSLKALAIREQKIHIIGCPELRIEGTPVYLDVEGLPDRDFYYLIGVRIRNGDAVDQHSLWADVPEDEERIWKEFVGILLSITNPILICYGGYESTFIRVMVKRYGAPCAGTSAERSLSSPINLLSAIYSRIYFPVTSNGLKEIAGYCGFRWSGTIASGIESIVFREIWEHSRKLSEKENLIRYNAEDCAALEVVTQKVLSLQTKQTGTVVTSAKDIVDISKQKREHPYGFKRNTFLIPEFEIINQAAYWDYQRERVYLKTSPKLKLKSRKISKSIKLVPNQIIDCQRPSLCPRCLSKKFYPHAKHSKTVTDLKFTRYGIKRWIVVYTYKQYLCHDCGKTFLSDTKPTSKNHFGKDLIAYYIYQCIELRLPMITIDDYMNRIFELGLQEGTSNRIKTYAANFYDGTFNTILKTLCNGILLHADETKITLRNSDGFVWIFASMQEVAYFYTDTREGDYVQSLLKDFKGVLVSDFYAAYDSVNCPQQKCLIHLIRDINDALYKNPYDEGIKRVAESFTSLLQPMVETVDRFGLKGHFLKKHLSSVDCFYKEISHLNLVTETAIKIRDRLEKNRDKLFTFLKYDGIPWNNNNAEHAVKSFAMLRSIIKGITTEKGLNEYLILLSISETCKYRGLDFLNFLRSGEKDIDVFGRA